MDLTPQYKTRWCSFTHLKPKLLVLEYLTLQTVFHCFTGCIYSDRGKYLSEISLFKAETCHLFKLQQVFCWLILQSKQSQINTLFTNDTNRWSKKCPVLDTHLFMSVSVAGFQLQNLLKAADGSHSIAQRQVTLALTQVTLWNTSDKPAKVTFTCSCKLVTNTVPEGNTTPTRTTGLF